MVSIRLIDLPILIDLLQDLGKNHHDIDLLPQDLGSNNRNVEGEVVFDSGCRLLVPGIDIEDRAVDFRKADAGEQAVEILCADDQRNPGLDGQVLEFGELDFREIEPVCAKTRLQNTCFWKISATCPACVPAGQSAARRQLEIFPMPQPRWATSAVRKAAANCQE